MQFLIDKHIAKAMTREIHGFIKSKMQKYLIQIHRLLLIKSPILCCLFPLLKHPILRCYLLLPSRQFQRELHLA